MPPPPNPLEELGTLRVLAGSLGLSQDVYSHLPPDEERANLRAFTKSLVEELDRRGMSIAEHLENLDFVRGVDDERVLRFPVK